MGMVKFEAEKSTYSRLLEKLFNDDSNDHVAEILVKLRTIRDLIKMQGDEIIVIVSTAKTFDEKRVVEPMPEQKPTPVKVQTEREESDACPDCAHRKTSHGKKGCRYCDCKTVRDYDNE